MLYRLFKAYGEDPDKLKEFVRETIDEMLRSLSPEKRLEGLSVEQIVQALSPEALEALRQRLKVKPADWPERFFEDIRIDDPAFGRPPQGAGGVAPSL